MVNFLRKMALFAIALFGIARLYYFATDDFRLGNIHHDMPYREEWEIPQLPDEEMKGLRELFRQKFSYIGKGAQSYAFASEDGEYVLKFFKFKHLRPSWLVDNLPSIGPLAAFRERDVAKKNRKLLSVFDGYRLAYEVHREEAGLALIHFNKSDYLNCRVTLVDKIGVERVVELDGVNFILQKRVETSRSVINSALAAGELEIAKERVRSLIDLYLSEYEKGIYDRDHGVLHNTGFIGAKPVHLDAGKLSRDEAIREPENAQRDLSLVIAKISTRTYEKFPELHGEIAGEMVRYLTEKLENPRDYLLECCYAR